MGCHQGASETGKAVTKPRADDLQLGAKTHSELTTTWSPWGQRDTQEQWGKCYAISLILLLSPIDPFPVCNSTEHGSSPHNIRHNFREEKNKLCTKAVRQTVSCIMKQAQGYVSKDNWDLQTAQVYGMNLVPKGRFPHWYFRTIRKPLKITSPPPFLHRDANSTALPASPPDVQYPAT